MVWHRRSVVVVAAINTKHRAHEEGEGEGEGEGTKRNHGGGRRETERQEKKNGREIIGLRFSGTRGDSLLGCAQVDTSISFAWGYLGVGVWGLGRRAEGGRRTERRAPKSSARTATVATVGSNL